MRVVEFCFPSEYSAQEKVLLRSLTSKSAMAESYQTLVPLNHISHVEEQVFWMVQICAEAVILQTTNCISFVFRLSQLFFPWKCHRNFSEHKNADVRTMYALGSHKIRSSNPHSVGTALAPMKVQSVFPYKRSQSDLGYCQTKIPALLEAVQCDPEPRPS